MYIPLEVASILMSSDLTICKAKYILNRFTFNIVHLLQFTIQFSAKDTQLIIGNNSGKVYVYKLNIIYRKFQYCIF